MKIPKSIRFIAMADGGTLLSELDNAPPLSDGDLVNSIYADLNTPSQAHPVVNRPAQRAPIQNQQGLGSTLPNAADPHVPTAHMIGREHPTQADFDRMVGQGPMPYNAGLPQMQQAPPLSGANSMLSTGSVPATLTPQATQDWKSPWLVELKQPLLVAIIVFIMTLPGVHLLIGHYAPKLLSPGGTFTTLGLLVRALLGGALFWVLQRIVVPLLSL